MLKRGGYGYQHHQNSYAMQQESQHQSSYAMHQQQQQQLGWNSNSEYQGHVLGSGHMPPEACFIDSQPQLHKNQVRVEGGGYGAKRHDGWHSHQTGRVHHGSVGAGFGKRMSKEFDTHSYNNSSHFSNAAMFDRENSMKKAEFEAFEEVCVPSGGAVRMKEREYERSSWGARNDGGGNYQHSFDNGGAHWGGHQRFEWTAKGV
ncbi:hypothetical protein CsatB_022306 [Cannabis sativa]